MSIKESALSAITSISNSDFVRAVTSAGASRRITVSNLAKQIIEGYAGSTVAGSAQSVKSALDSLNSNMASFAGWKTGGSFNDYRRTGMFMLNGVSEAPSSAVSTYALLVITSSPITVSADASTCKQIAFAVNGNSFWSRQYIGGSWSAWLQL